MFATFGEIADFWANYALYQKVVSGGQKVEDLGSMNIFVWCYLGKKSQSYELFNLVTHVDNFLSFHYHNIHLNIEATIGDIMSGSML